MASHLTHFWTLFLTDFHVIHINLKLKPSPHEYDLTMVLECKKGIKMPQTVPKLVNICNFGPIFTVLYCFTGIVVTRMYHNHGLKMMGVRCNSVQNYLQK